MKDGLDKDGLFEAALWYAKRGLRVFPAWGVGLDGGCLCPARHSCCSPGKHPALRGWPERATRDAGQIREWWQRRPSGNVALVFPSNYVVLDVDDRPSEGKHGTEKLAALVSGSAASLPATITQFTPSGGRHLVFRLPDSAPQVAQRALVPGHIDVRVGGRGYILAEPSRHRLTWETGRTYQWAADAHPAHMRSAVLPDWLVGLLGGRSEIGGDPSTVEPCQCVESAPLFEAARAAGWLRGTTRSGAASVTCPWSVAGTAPVGAEGRHPIGTPSSSVLLPPTSISPHGAFSCLHRCAGHRRTRDFVRALPGPARRAGDARCRQLGLPALAAVASTDGLFFETARMRRRKAWRRHGPDAWLDEIAREVTNAPTELRAAAIRAAHAAMRARNVSADTALEFITDVGGFAKDYVQELTR